MKKVQRHRMLSVAIVIVVAMSAATMGKAQTFSVLHVFASQTGDPESPQNGVTQGGDGDLYGTSPDGGANSMGTVYKISPKGELRVLYSFCSQANCADGSDPDSGLTLRPDGHFLGTTATGGSFNQGTIFDITQTGTLTVLYNFTGGNDGAFPTAPPILGPDGSFYGTARNGGLPDAAARFTRLQILVRRPAASICCTDSTKPKAAIRRPR